MIKSLKIDGEKIIITKGEKSLKINERSLEEIIAEKLPEEVKKYEECLGDISISITIYTGGELVTDTNYSQEE